MAVDAWLIFVGVWIAASVPLGPNALYCISTSAAVGFSRSLWSVAGRLVAAFCHMMATLLGIATLLLANAELFQLLKYFGAAYLVWMGITLWRKRTMARPDLAKEKGSALKITRQAFLISMTNPKSIIAYLAVFSQFVHHDETLIPQMIVLIPTALGITTITYSVYCGLGRALTRLLSTARRLLAFDRLIGSIYIAAGAGLALADIKPAVSAPQVPR